MLEVQNARSDPISVRTHTATCPAGAVAVDMWGTSKEEIVPDILNASGMCGYRPWYEHRQLVSHGTCSASYCTVTGSSTWNFTSPRRTPAPAFESDVLKVHPHACDRNYEHAEGLVSCAPNASFYLTDASGNTLYTLVPVNSTRTYRLLPNGDTALPVVRQPNTGNLGAGFLGTNLTYAQLGYASATNPQASAPRPTLCGNLGICALQTDYRMWNVNGGLRSVRYVLPASGAQRAYTKQDMIGCGSMGFLDGAACRLDRAVVPLFYVACNGQCLSTVTSLCSQFCTPGFGQYASGQLAGPLETIAASLNTLFQTLKSTPTTWAQYLSAVEAAKGYWTQMQAAPLPQYPDGVGAPTGLYYLLSYGAYEVPFAWWFRCGWLGGLTMSTGLVDCPAWSGRAHTATPAPLLQWLATLDGGYATSTVADARNAQHQAYVAAVNVTVRAALAKSLSFQCHASASANQSLLGNDAYERAFYEARGRSWDGPVPNVCPQDGCLDHGPAVDTGLDFVGDILTRLVAKAKPCDGLCQCTTNLHPQVCAWYQDNIPTTIPANSASLPLFIPQGFQETGGSFNDLPAKYDPQNAGCSTYPTAPLTCLFAKVQPEELQTVGVSDVNASLPPWLVFAGTASAASTATPTASSTSGDGWFAVDVCAHEVNGARCNLLDQPTSDPCVGTTTTAALVQAQYCLSTSPFDNTNPQSSQCVPQACLEGKHIRNTYASVPPGIDLSVVSAPPLTCYLLHCPAVQTADTVAYQNALDSANAAWLASNASTSAAIAAQQALLAAQQQYTQSVGTVNPQLVLSIVDYIARNQTAWHNAAQVYARAAASQAILDGIAALTFGSPSMDGQTVLDDTLYTQTKYIETNVTVFQYTYTVSKPIFDATAIVDVNGEFVLQATLDHCVVNQGCVLNPQRTRLMSDQYAKVVSFTGSGYYKLVLQSVIANTEDRFTTDSKRNQVCGARLPSNLGVCNYSTPSGSNGLLDARECSDTMTLAKCLAVGLKVCESFSTDGSCGPQLGALDYIPVVGLYDTIGSAITCSGSSPYDNCMSHFQTLDTCVQSYSMQCTQYTYLRTEVHTACTSTPGSCPYDHTPPGQPSWEAQYAAAGLPSVGYCPACSGLFCPAQKSSSTYAIAQARTGLHTFSTQSVATGGQLGPNAVHYQIKTTTANIMCLAHNLTCPALQRPIQVRKGLWACAYCLAAPLQHCTGPHRCAFDNGNGTTSSYAQAFAQARAAIESHTPAAAPVTPYPFPFMVRPPGFTAFNPSTLNSQFNAMIEGLHSECNLQTNLPDFTQCQNDLPRTTLRAYVQSQYKVKEGATIPPGGTLTWPTTYSQLTGPTVPAWEAVKLVSGLGDGTN